MLSFLSWFFEYNTSGFSLSFRMYFAVQVDGDVGATLNEFTKTIQFANP